ncbi:MFS transporter [Lactiplantibacillus pentosus]|jgi:SP family arabinose:H+ symporter-like MFS transporter|uniref:sugar porter family MFS transporter n=2 Tax=Lactobacillaceae TaxID=33958 RepID=UPI000C7D3E17|nr:sugar porter family MFS transporter [Lactiplantibacillus pentosus]AUI80038.1 MFS transporter [Lactiplantibacillus pentosus]MBO9165084.1 sugar porter family MFS transporter [Lactiplantibacillus pentosus]MCE6030298.1 sugar porter family MFS transporter [Lactiplantibacillus pentosus]MCT3064953.1 MFS transporter [Lactiplantibacillus pentosus]MCT3276395.1 MFS transporter [Lactiplantibacillus pentosus]
MKSKKKISSYVILISCAAALGGLLFGYDTAVISGAVGFLQIKFSLTSAEVGWVTSCILIGCAIGVSVAGILSDLFGRKKILALSAIIFALSSLGAAFSSSYLVLVIWRMLAGVGIGLTSLITPLYIAEMAPADVRGKLVSVNQLAITIGIFIVYFINAAIASGSGNAWNVSTGWRWMMGIGVIPSALFLIALIPAGESPRWLAQHGKKGEALKVLKKVESNELVAKQQFEEIQKAETAVDDTKFSDLFNKTWLPVLIIGVLLALFQQFSGSNAIMYYAPEIFKGAGFGQNGAFMATVSIGVINMVITVVSLGLVDRIGRKKLLGWGSLAMSLCLLVVAICFFTRASTAITLTFILLAIASYAISLAPVTWLLISEIFPSKIRGRAMSICTVVLWLSDFTLSYTFPILTQNIGEGWTFMLYVVVTALSALFVWKMVPETQGKSLEEIEGYWNNREMK